MPTNGSQNPGDVDHELLKDGVENDFVIPECDLNPDRRRRTREPERNSTKGKLAIGLRIGEELAARFGVYRVKSG